MSERLDLPGPDHRAEPVTVEVEATVIQTVPSTVKSQLSHYAKAIMSALLAGLLYFLTVLSPAATFGQITLFQWIGFFVAVLGSGLGVAAIPNGPKPTAPTK